MKHLRFTQLCQIGFFIGFVASPVTVSSFTYPVIIHQILGEWYLEEQEMLINGKDFDLHFEEMAAQMTASTGHQFNPRALADKFREGYQGIPTGTKFKFNDDFSYSIELPNSSVQQGMWQVKSAHMLLLQAQGDEMYLEVKNINEKKATFSIVEEKANASTNGSRYQKMEIVIDLSR